jgi:hypothetical protein
MKTIKIYTIPMQDQRFTTQGDWKEDDKELNIWITDMGDWKCEFGVFVHEIVEWAICKHMGVTSDECDAFDALFEKEYDEGKWDISVEAGYDPRCPYRKGHVWGDRVSRVMLWLIGVSWKEYGKVCDACIQRV